VPYSLSGEENHLNLTGGGASEEELSRLGKKDTAGVEGRGGSSDMRIQKLYSTGEKSLRTRLTCEKNVSDKKTL